MYRIGVRCSFSAAHQLKGYKGKCSRLHGHTWSVEAVFRAEEIGWGGMVLDFKEARDVLEKVVGPFDHSFLNEMEPFNSITPTAEEVARVIFERLLMRSLELSPPADLESVTVWESPDSRASFSAD